MAHDFKKMENDILEKEIRHDENVIDKKRGNINEHEMKCEKSDNKFMNDIRKEEVKHDEKVIERKEDAADRHEEKVRENEQEINNVK